MRSRWSNDRLYRLLCVCLIICAFLFVTINIFVLVILLLAGKTPPLSFEAACIETIIGILGIAVSVWVGILVVDRLDHKEIRNLSEKAKEIEEQQILNEQLSLRLLLDDLEANKNNPIAQWISKKIKNIDETAFPYGLWIAFREEEHLYRQMQQTIGKASREVYNQYNNCIKRIRDTIGHYKESGASVTAIEEILCLREAEAKFLYAYSIEKNERSVGGNVDEKGAAQKAATYFIGALEYYEENSDKFGLDLSNDFSGNTLEETAAAAEIQALSGGRKELEFAYIAYIFNFIGEAYSKLVQYNNNYGVSICQNKDLNSCKYLALNYCLLAVTAANAGNCWRETYCRDYGCAIERVFSKEPDENKKKYNGKPYLEAAIDQYKAALKLDSNEKIYHCLASAYNKDFEAEVSLSKKKTGTIVKIKLNDEEKKKGKEILDKYKPIQMQYLACFPNELMAHVFSVFYYRDQYLVNPKEVPYEYLKYHCDMIELLLPEEKPKNNTAYEDGRAILEKIALEG